MMTFEYLAAPFAIVYPYDSGDVGDPKAVSMVTVRAAHQRLRRQTQAQRVSELARDTARAGCHRHDKARPISRY